MIPRTMLSLLACVTALFCASSVLGQEATVTVRAGETFTSKLTALSPTCRPVSYPVRFTSLPRYGKVRVSRSSDFQRTHPSAECNYRVVPAISVRYLAPRSVGHDSFSLFFGPDHYKIMINIVP
jgi:hypothetical protein